MLTYSTNPERDAARYEAACEWEAAMQDARTKTLYDDTMDAVKRGDLSRIVETFSWDEENGRIAAAAMNTQALEALARIWANEHAKP
jgi:hypothetical protein